jgi:hypothetical protein
LSRSYLGGDEGSLGEAASDQLANEGLPEDGLESSGAQEAPVFLAPEGLTFYDVPATDPDGRGATVTVVLNGSDDEGYAYCAVAIRPPGANIYDDAVFNFVVGGEARSGF